MKIIKLLSTLIANICTISFGIWHFFVPKIWNWYDAIDKSANELIIAFRAINVFFSLCLVLFGLMNLIFAFSKQSNLFSRTILLVSILILWSTRILMQIIYPQGTEILYLKEIMIAIFIIIFSLYLTTLLIQLYENKKMRLTTAST